MQWAKLTDIEGPIDGQKVLPQMFRIGTLLISTPFVMHQKLSLSGLSVYFIINAIAFKHRSRQ